MTQERLPVNSVECVFEINLNEDRVWVIGPAQEPFSCRLQTDFGAERLRHTDLVRPEQVASLVIVRGAQNFSSEASEKLAYCDGAKRTVLFGKSGELGACQPLGKLVWCATPYQKGNQGMR